MKGTWNIVTKIMRKNGFKIRRGETPFGLEAEIRDMLSEAYCIGYSDGKE